jgi:hypothetical protein
MLAILISKIVVLLALRGSMAACISEHHPFLRLISSEIAQIDANLTINLSIDRCLSVSMYSG